MAGFIAGRAPLFERFVLGTSSTLRGWNKFDVDPLGGDRMVHNTVEYHYRLFEAFYDTGAVWTQGQTAVARHSVGASPRGRIRPRNRNRRSPCSDHCRRQDRHRRAGVHAVASHSVGAGLRHDGIHLAVAFPMREGRVEPVFMLGMNY